MKYTPGNIRMWSRLGPSGAMSAAMLELGQTCDKMLLLSADMSVVSGAECFKLRYPDRHFEVGIAEQMLIGMAAGLANEGFIPYTLTYGTFLSTRAMDQVKMNLAYMKHNVKMVGVLSGLCPGLLGPTHVAIEDIAIMRAVPNITILCPADGAEIVKAIIAAATWEGPVYLRMTGSLELPIIHNEDFTFEIGKAMELSEGQDVQIIATGCIAAAAVDACRILEDDGVSCGVTNMHTLRPLDTACLNKHAHRARLIVTLEEHKREGGLGSAVCEYLCDQGFSVPVMRIGLPDVYPGAASYGALLEEAGLTASAIAQRIKERMIGGSK